MPELSQHCPFAQGGVVVENYRWETRWCVLGVIVALAGRDSGFVPE